MDLPLKYFTSDILDFFKRIHIYIYVYVSRILVFLSSRYTTRLFVKPVFPYAK